MNKQLVGIGIGVIVLAVVGFTLLSPNKTDSVTAVSSGTLVAKAAVYDFGTVPMSQGDVIHEYIVENQGTEPVTVNRVYTSCGCTTAQILDGSGVDQGMFGMQGHGFPDSANVVVEPGDFMAVRAIYDPAAHGPQGTGPARRMIYLESNSETTPRIELSFNAVVTN